MQMLHREYLKAGIREKFGTLKAFEQARGLAEGAVKGVLVGKTSQRTVDAMAEVLNLPADVITASIKAGTEESPDHTSTKVDSHRLNEGAE